MLAFILRLVFPISHEQATVECGISLNNPNNNKTNISPKTFTSKRIILDQMLSHKLKPDSIESDRRMRPTFESEICNIPCRGVKEECSEGKRR